MPCEAAWWFVFIKQPCGLCACKYSPGKRKMQMTQQEAVSWGEAYASWVCRDNEAGIISPWTINSHQVPSCLSLGELQWPEAFHFINSLCWAEFSEHVHLFNTCQSRFKSFDVFHCALADTGVGIRFADVFVTPHLSLLSCAEHLLPWISPHCSERQAARTVTLTQSWAQISPADERITVSDHFNICPLQTQHIKHWGVLLGHWSLCHHHRSRFRNQNGNTICS